MDQQITTKKQAEAYLKKLKTSYKPPPRFNHIEEGETFRKLLPFFTQGYLASELGVSRSYIYQRVRAAENLIPELKEMAREGKIPAYKSYLISQLPPEGQQQHLEKYRAEQAASTCTVNAET